MNYEQGHQPTPSYGTPPAERSAALVCPKCRGAMRSYERNGITVDQCETCRGIFLDFGELEALTRLEGQLAAPAQQPVQQQPVQQYPAQQYPPQYAGPGWGHHGGYSYRRGGLSRIFFSS